MKHRCKNWMFHKHGGPCLRWAVRSRRCKTVVARFFLRGDAIICCRMFNDSSSARKKWGSFEYRKGAA